MTARRVTPRWYSGASAATGAARRNNAVVEPLFDGPLLSIGRFRCPPGDERWSEENWIGSSAHVVFPHVPVTIRQRHREPVLADPTQVVLYDTGTFYERRQLSPDGDRSTFVILKAGCLPAGVDGFATTHLPIESAELLRLHVLASLCARPDAAPLEVEELAIDLVARIVGRVPGPAGVAIGAVDGRRPATRRSHHDLVGEARRRLQLTSAESVTLSEVAAGVGASPFHLARLFRAATGMSMHDYRIELRLRASLERLVETRDDLARLALDLGFASHSHFDVRFRRAFGHAPSTVRSLLRAGGDETRTLVKALRSLPA